MGGICYDELNQFNASSKFSYDAQGRILTATDPLGTVTKRTYDSLGDLISTTRDYGRLNITSSFAYDSIGNVIASTDPNGNRTTFAFDANRRTTGVTSPWTSAGIRVDSFYYDANGQLLTKQSQAGAILVSTSTSYTLTGKVATTTDARGEPVPEICTGG